MKDLSKHMVRLCVVMPAMALAATLQVANVAELESAVWNAASGDVISLTNTALRVYDLSQTTHRGTPGHLYTASGITLKGATGNPDDIVIRGAGNRILYLDGPGNSICNLTFENGDVTSYEKQTSVQPYDYPRGGAILFSRSNAGTVSNCVFRNNRASLAGGAAATYKAQNFTGASFVNCIFANNAATDESACGGALFMAADVKGCCFADNHLTGAESMGGAVFNARSIVDCAFTNNSAAKGGGAVYYQPNTATPTPLVSGCSFVENRANDRGSALCASTSWGEALLVSNCTFRSNAPLGAGVVDGTVADLANVVDCLFVGNTARYGGAAYASTLKGCLLECNVATDTAGAAYASILRDCTNRANVNASANVKASELANNCRAYGCVFTSVGNSAKMAFDGGVYDRCRFLSATNGYLFSGTVTLTNCLIAACTNCYLLYKTSAASSFVNATIVDNVFSAFKTSHACGLMTIGNTFFYGNQLNKVVCDIDQSAPNAVAAFNHCIFSAANGAYAPGTDNLNYFGDVHFSPGFVGVKASAEDQYALKLYSPAVAKPGAVADWMAGAMDIRGEGFPRLRDGVVNIGCYQCWLDPVGTQVIFR